MMLSDEQLDLCNDKLHELDDKELTEIIKDMIFHYWTKKEYIQLIENNFQNDDWRWFYDEYVVGVPDV